MKNYRKFMVMICVIVILCSMAMGGCNNLEPKGEFYTLQQGYDNGLITIEELQTIAYYHSNGHNCSYITPIPKDPESLDEETMQKIKNDGLILLLDQKDKDGKQKYPNATINDISVMGYYGTYNGVIAVKIAGGFHGWAGMVQTTIIEGVEFTYSGVLPVLWKENKYSKANRWIML